MRVGDSCHAVPRVAVGRGVCTGEIGTGCLALQAAILNME